jgi:SEFIR domain-containing protein
MLKQVFLSYRHESLEHARAVLRLGQLLRQAKIPVAMDQFYLDDNPEGPNEGWPKWCEDCANGSACVLIIASEGWFAAYNRTAEPGGLGAATEADLFRQVFWDERGHNERVRLAFLHEVAANKVPVRLRAWHSFRPFESDAALDRLIRWLADCLQLRNIESPIVRWPGPLLDFQPDIVDRHIESLAIGDMLAGRSRERILLLEGASGLGKSVLVHHASTYAKKLGIPAVRVNFKGGLWDVPDILGQLDLELGGEFLPKFSREGANKTNLLRRDLRALRQPVLIVFDSYEYAAENKTVSDWLSKELLNEVETSLGLAVIVAGQRVPDPARAFWRELARLLQLGPITELAHWEPWIERRYPSFRHKGVDLPTVLMIARGNPAVIATICEAIEQS